MDALLHSGELSTPISQRVGDTHPLPVNTVSLIQSGLYYKPNVELITLNGQHDLLQHRFGRGILLCGERTVLSTGCKALVRSGRFGRCEKDLFVRTR